MNVSLTWDGAGEHVLCNGKNPSSSWVCENLENTEEELNIPEQERRRSVKCTEEKKKC